MSEPAAVLDNSASRFADYVTSQAFALHLSRPMIESLVYTVMTSSDTSTPFPNNGLGSWSALERRGLIERSWTHGPNGGRKHRIKATEAGKLVYQLCLLAGLVSHPGSEQRRGE